MRRTLAPVDATRRARTDVEAWLSGAMIDDATPLDAEDLVRLLRHGVSALGIDPSVTESFSVNTVHYYRRKDIIDPPDGRTAAARYGRRHLLQVLGARLAGQLGLVTLDEARTQLRGASAERLISFAAARVSEARAKRERRGDPALVSTEPIRPLPGRAGTSAAAMIALPGDAWCVVPATHAAHRSRAAAQELARSLVNALHPHRET